MLENTTEMYASLRPKDDAKMSLCSLFITEGITDHDLDTFVDMYREHCEVGILLDC